MIKKIINKFKSPPVVQPDYQIIVVHTRATDRVYFGPFKNITELNNWQVTNPAASRVSPSIQLLISPNANPDEWWYTSLNDPQSLKPSHLAVLD